MFKMRFGVVLKWFGVVWGVSTVRIYKCDLAFIYLIYASLSSDLQ